jgi:hypothetical protein
VTTSGTNAGAFGGAAHLAEKIGHFDGGYGGVETFVAAFSACAVDGLLESVGGEYAERDGNSI